MNNPVTDEEFSSQVADYVAAIGVEEITPKDIEDLMWLKGYEDGPRLATYLKTPKGQYFYMEALRLARKPLREVEVPELSSAQKTRVVSEFKELMGRTPTEVEKFELWRQELALKRKEVA